jgi:hypothetical protein
MKIFVKVKPSSKEEKIVKVDDNHYRIAVKEPPVNGRANVAVINSLATFFKTPKSGVRIISGFTSKEKVIEIS